MARRKNSVKRVPFNQTIDETVVELARNYSDTTGLPLCRLLEASLREYIEKRSASLDLLRKEEK